MESRIETLAPKKLIGLSMEMSLVENRTGELWGSFMPRRAEVDNRMSTDFISMQQYDHSKGDIFSPTTVFTKWAVVEVSSLDLVPEGMDTYDLACGLYVVFVHHGPASAFMKSMSFIYGEWFPESEYELDDREHFEVLPEGYSPVDPEAREEIWVPIR